jgi:hypothetical protein
MAEIKDKIKEKELKKAKKAAAIAAKYQQN